MKCDRFSYLQLNYKIQHFFTATVEEVCSDLCKKHCTFAYSKANIVYIEGFIPWACNRLWALMH